jgi:hypothetical protein
MNWHIFTPEVVVGSMGIAAGVFFLAYAYFAWEKLPPRMTNAMIIVLSLLMICCGAVTAFSKLILKALQ